jgi:putative nucleotidyltransferase with HDIG domain
MHHRNIEVIMPPCAAESSLCTEANSQPSTSTRLIERPEIRLSEIMSALSVALDITQGQPEGHCMRTALIGMKLAESLDLASADRSALFYALLLKDLGCSSNAAKITYLFGADDHLVKRSGRMIDWNKAGQNLKNCWKQCAPSGSVVEKLLRMAAMARSGKEGARKISEVRCDRGASIARMLHLPDATAKAIYDLDEHWNGSGFPRGLRGDEISRLGRICCLAQTVEVFFTAYGLSAAMDVVQQRRGEWFDPAMVDAMLALRGDAQFWEGLMTGNLLASVGHWEPADAVLWTDEQGLDDVAEAFAMVVDAKSPWTYQHSTRVAEIAVGVADQFGCSPEVIRDIRRAALLHDIGKLGVSNLILDKPGKPTAEEFAQIRKHPDYTEQILKQVDALSTLADVASAHHERLDGRGYHRRLESESVPWVGRVLMVADIAEALSAKRPYRDALPWEKIVEIMSADAGAGVDPDCFAALQRWWNRTSLESRVNEQMQAVDDLLAEL